MKIEDKEFQQLKKQVQRRTLRNNVSITLLVLAALLGFVGFGISWYYNIGPFQQAKVAWVPDNQFRLMGESQDELHLLFDSYGVYGYNTQAKAITVYLDYYEQAERKTHMPIVSMETEGEATDYNGKLYWGLFPSENKNDHITKWELKTVIQQGSGKSAGQVDLADIVDFDSTSFTMWQSNITSKEAIKTDKQLYLLHMNTSGISYTNFADNFTEENLKTAGNTLVVYAVFD